MDYKDIKKDLQLILEKVNRLEQIINTQYADRKIIKSFIVTK